jgi:hypothetical protein
MKHKSSAAKVPCERRSAQLSVALSDEDWIYFVNEMAPSDFILEHDLF